VPGHADVHRVVDVPAGADVNEDVAPGPAMVQPALASAHAPVPDSSPRWHPSRVGAYVAFGSAAALAAGGIVAWSVRQNAAGIWNDDQRCLQPGAGTRAQQCGSYEETANVALGLEIGAFSAAVVSAGVGTWLLVRAIRSPASAAAWCAPGVLGVTCEGTF
jgi:hypothetical protein